jgi:biopolymer transport protein ExbD
MRFLVRKRRTAPAVIIVALIDVLIVLVIFLLVTTTFKQQPAMHLTLPESTQALKSGATNEPPFIVSIGADGVFRAGANNDVIMPDQLRGRLQQEAAKNPQLKLAVRADKDAHWEKIVQIMDAAKKANLNVKSVSAFTKEPGK